MADIITFPARDLPLSEAYREERVIGEETGIRVRILSRVRSPHTLLVVLDGTFEGTSTIATLAEDDVEMAAAIVNSTLAALEAAEITWSLLPRECTTA